MDQQLIKYVLALGALVVASVLASKITSKFGIPILLIFIGVGVIAGSEGLVGIYFDDAEVAQMIGTVALILILFSGGLSTNFNQVRLIWKEGVVLSTFGVIISMFVMGALIKLVLDWSWASSLLFGAIISSTDAAAVFGILKNKNLGIQTGLRSLLEFESGSNDPLAVFLTLNLIKFIKMDQEFSWLGTLGNLGSQMVIGIVFGWVLAQALVKMINLLDLEAEGLYPVLTLAGAICIYGLSEYCGGNGFLSVYIAGLTMGGQRYFSKKTLTVFHDGLAWIMQCLMFLMLGLLVFPRELPSVMVPGVILAILLLLVARPISMLPLFFFKYSWRQWAFLSWGGLRGAVPIILATYALVGNIEEAHPIFNMVFFIVIVSMTIQGMSLNFMARILKVQTESSGNIVMPFFSEAVHRDFVSYEIEEQSSLIDLAILELDLPGDVLIVLIKRGGKEFIPRGSTEIKAGDVVICLCNQNHFPTLDKLFKE